MTSRKRGRQELEADNNNASSSHAPSVLDRIRNMWQFANLMQYLFIFGKVVRVDENIGIEVESSPIACPFVWPSITRRRVGLVR